jgi:hypothetical protein
MWYATSAIVGFVCGLLMYHHLLDKPEVINNENIEIRKIKQRGDGVFNNFFEKRRKKQAQKKRYN